MEHPRHIYSVGKAIALISSFVLMIATMLPWGVITDKTGQESIITGLAGDGKITIVLGAMSVILLILKKAPHWLVIIFGLMAMAIGIIDLIAVMGVTKTALGYVGSGLYATAIAGLGIVVGTLIEIFKKKRTI
jgi:hypothetical protein